MEFVSLDGNIKKMINLNDTKDMQFFDIDLPKGKYRVYIRSIYKGTNWSDTCLGEIRFYKDIRKVIEEDDFLKIVFSTIIK
ncbi:MAG TPA: hypothetical protein PKW55_06035 [Spirochaetota bacterium]|nr:hypothetical protein [Spirochaetota bacterium]HOM38442.1 hypothetical protein [Spirochaetota bacterium]HPQ48982.1 hypothetical protein [Spirochaetota bacterium]